MKAEVWRLQLHSLAANLRNAHLAQSLVGEDINANPAGWEALIQIGMKHGVDFTAGANEILAELEPMSAEI